MSAFEHLPVPVNLQPLPEDFRMHWVKPLYLTNPADPEFRALMIQRRREVDEDVIRRLLGDENWRSRKVGACFIGVYDFPSQIQTLGHLLLRNQYQIALRSYAVSLASLPQFVAWDYLTEFLNHYLHQSEFVGQSWVLAALMARDAIHHSDLHGGYMETWQAVAGENPDRIFEMADLARREIEALQTLRRDLAAL